MILDLRTSTSLSSPSTLQAAILLKWRRITDTGSLTSRYAARKLFFSFLLLSVAINPFALQQLYLDESGVVWLWALSSPEVAAAASPNITCTGRCLLGSHYSERSIFASFSRPNFLFQASTGLLAHCCMPARRSTFGVQLIPPLSSLRHASLRRILSPSHLLLCAFSFGQCNSLTSRLAIFAHQSLIISALQS